MAIAQKPDVILMDIMMPKMDGLTACHVIKKDPATKAIPVIMVTAIGFELNIKLSQQMGANGYVTKPFSPQDLLGKITEALANQPVASVQQPSDSQ
jgi:CheY-like chemotaxis protein